MFVGLSSHADLSDDGGDAGRVSGEQMNAGQLIGGTAAEGLAIDSERIAQVGAAGRNPAGQGLLEDGDIQTAEEVRESGFAGRLAGAEAESMGQGLSVFASKLGDGFEGAHTGEHGDGEKVEQSR